MKNNPKLVGTKSTFPKRAEIIGKEARMAELNLKYVQNQRKKNVTGTKEK